MKQIIILLTAVILTAGSFSQNINGKLGTNGQFIIRDTTNTYLTLPQSTGYLNLNRSLVLPNTLSSTLGVIFKGNDIFMHNYGVQNTFLGTNAGNLTLTGIRNTAIGYFALPLNSTGIENSAVGNGSLRYSTTGSSNTAFGNASLFSNTTGDQNTAIGSWSLSSNTTGIFNSALGYRSLNSNSTGNANTSVGYESLFSSATGEGNTAIGSVSLYSNTTGHNNVAVGNQALYYNTTGINNIAIGFNAQVPSGIGNNQVRIGNTSITYAGIQVAWSITSDRNLKNNIYNSNLGLGFISKLRPVSYTRKNDESGKTEYGLIAQEVEESLKEEGAENSAMLTITDNGEYQLRYNDLLAPMIKAIQELNEKNEKISAENYLLKAENNTLIERLAKIELIQSTLSSEIEQINKEMLKHPEEPENKTIILNSN
jgi:hypothetical protein